MADLDDKRPEEVTFLNRRQKRKLARVRLKRDRRGIEDVVGEELVHGKQFVKIQMQNSFSGSVPDELLKEEG